MQKEDSEDRIIALCYCILVFTMMSEPFIFLVTNKEQIRMYMYLLSLIGAIILVTILNKEEVKSKNGLSLHK